MKSHWIVLDEREEGYDLPFYVEDENNVSMACWAFEDKAEARKMADEMNAAENKTNGTL